MTETPDTFHLQGTGETFEKAKEDLIEQFKAHIRGVNRIQGRIL